MENVNNYFVFGERIDTTFSNQIDRFVNHTTKHQNCVAKPVRYGSTIIICLFTLINIFEGTELRYHYGLVYIGKK